MTEVTEERSETAQTTQESTETAIDLLATQDVHTQKEISRFTRKKFRKKWIVLAVLLLAAGGFVAYNMLKPKPTGIPVMAAVLEKTDLVNRISLSGVVESADSARVHSSLQSELIELNVQVGDRIEAGEVLARFDTSDLELSIAKQQAVMKQDTLINEHTIEVNRKRLENAESDVKSGLESKLLNAENYLRNTQLDLNDARREYNDAQDAHTSADDELTKAEKDLRKAEKDLLAAEENKTNVEKDPNATETEKKEAAEKAEEAKDTLRKAETELLNAEAVGDALSKERQDYRRARVSYENALADKLSIENAIKQELEGYEDTIKGSELSADQTASQLELKRMQKDLDESTLTAPISGTVTAVYAKVGEPGKGLMFVIEDTEALVIKTKVKEYDVTTVQEGMKAEVKADATGEAVFDGEVEKIYPTAVKDADGSVKDSGSVEFETDVALTTEDSGLRVGMNVRLNVIAAEKSGVFAVPFEAVALDAEGKEVVYTMTEPNEEGKIFAKSVPITSGMETDFYLEISGEGLGEGMQIISAPEGVTDGAEVRLAPAGMAGMMANGVA